MTVPLERQKNIADVAARLREQLGLGSAAVYNAGDFATATQGEKAESALPADMLPITATRNGMEALQFPAGMNSLETRGYGAMGDGGGAQYVRVAAEPSHALKVRSLDRFLPDGSTSADDGGWWEIAEKLLTPQMCGAKGDGITPDTAAIQTWLSGGGGELVGEFVIDGPISVKIPNGIAPSMVGRGTDKSILLFTTTDASITISGHHARVKDIWFNPTIPAVEAGLILGDATRVWHSHRHLVTGNHFGPMATGPNYFRKAIWTHRLWYTPISDNGFRGPSGQADNVSIYAEASVNITCTGNTMEFGGTFLQWAGTLTGWPEGGFTPHYNEGWQVIGNAAAGLHRFFISNGGLLVTITGNVIDIIQEEGITAFGSRHIISGNWFGISASDKHAVVLHAAVDTIISDNIFILPVGGSGVRLHAVSGTGADRVSVTDNKFIGGANCVTLVDACAQPVITGNVMLGQTTSKIIADKSVGAIIRDNRLLGSAPSTMPSVTSGTVMKAEVMFDQVVSLVGGVAVETVTVPISSGIFQNKPRVVLCGNTGGYDDLIFYDYNSSTPTSLVFKVMPRTGGNVVAKAMRFAVHAIENI